MFYRCQQKTHVPASEIIQRTLLSHCVRAGGAGTGHAQTSSRDVQQDVQPSYDGGQLGESSVDGVCQVSGQGRPRTGLSGAGQKLSSARQRRDGEREETTPALRLRLEQDGSGSQASCQQVTRLGQLRPVHGFLDYIVLMHTSWIQDVIKTDSVKTGTVRLTREI